MWQAAGETRVRSKGTCIDSCITLNSSDIACGEYASRTLTGRQASSMAKTTAIVSGEKTRAKGDFCGLHPGTRGGTPDEQYTLAVFWAKSVQAVSKNDVKR